MELRHRPLRENPCDENRVFKARQLLRPHPQMVSRHELIPEIPHPAQFVLADIRIPFRGHEVHYPSGDRKVDHRGLQAHDTIADEGDHGVEAGVGRGGEDGAGDDFEAEGGEVREFRGLAGLGEDRDAREGGEMLGELGHEGHAKGAGRADDEDGFWHFVCVFVLRGMRKGKEQCLLAGTRCTITTAELGCEIVERLILFTYLDCASLYIPTGFEHRSGYGKIETHFSAFDQDSWLTSDMREESQRRGGD